MKKGFVHAALCALTLAVPAAAERIYVPALGTAADGSPLATTRTAWHGRSPSDLPKR
jgi:hypothetical protein